MAASRLIGIDLSGPSNPDDTAVATFSLDGGAPSFVSLARGFDDAALIASVASWDEDVVVGLDAPLSYEPGGGDRDAERGLRARVKGLLPSGSIMTPTMTRMAYLTLRGVSVARLILALRPAARIVETHPAAHLALAGAPLEDVRALKGDAACRARLLEWLGRNGLSGVPRVDVSDHEVAALAAARAAWSWSRDESVWCERAKAPVHPFDVAV